MCSLLNESHFDRASDTGVTVRSPAKINWYLNILGRRPDGFHELESLVSAVTLYDELTFVPRDQAGVELVCDHPGIPADQRNLIWRAAELMARRAERRDGVSCRVSKRIPAGGGLGGGSSNAALTLLALNRMWGLNWPVDRLHALAAELGSDVPFFLYGGTALMAGRGERIERRTLPWRGWVVLVLPDLSISTAEVYRNWSPADMSDRPDIPSRVESAEDWLGYTYNLLETPALRVCPELGPLLETSRQLAGRPVRVSGSGSTFFTAFDRRAEAEQFARSVAERMGLKSYIVQPVEQSEQGGLSSV